MNATHQSSSSSSTDTTTSVSSSSSNTDTSSTGTTNASTSSIPTSVETSVESVESVESVDTSVETTVGGNDDVVIELNKQAFALLPEPKELQIVPGATHLFEEPGALEEVARLATEWFLENMAGRAGQ